MFILTVLRYLQALPKWGVIVAVRGYQLAISPLLPPTCRFRPTCSQYMIEAVQKYGLLRGVWKGICRLAKCHPFHPPGDDPP